MEVPVLNTGSVSARGLLPLHAAVGHTLSLLLQLWAGGASVGGPQEDVTRAVADATPGAGTQTQTPGGPERHLTIQRGLWKRGEKDTMRRGGTVAAHCYRDDGWPEIRWLMRFGRMWLDMEAWRSGDLLCWVTLMLPMGGSSLKRG